MLDSLEGDLMPAQLLPPQSVELEQSLLGALLKAPQLFPAVAGWIAPLHFYQTAHKNIFQAMTELFAAQCPIDVVSVTAHLRELNLLEASGGVSYTMELLDGGAGVAIEAGGETAIRYHGRNLIDLAKRRELLVAAEEMAMMAHDLSRKAYSEQAQTLLLSLTDAYQLEERQDSAQEIDNAMATLETELETTHGLTGLSTGFPSLDRATHGFQPYQLITLAARPGGGKSAMAVNIASHVAMQERRPVLYISLEMTATELLKRIIRAMAGSEKDLPALRQAAEDLKPHRPRLMIDDTPGLTLSALQSRVLKTKRAHPELALVVIDHLGLIAPEASQKNQNRAYEIQLITGTLKRLARSIETPILQLAQMNRAIEARQDKKPMLSDLRDSGSIEMDSDVVLFVNVERHDDRRASGGASLTIAKQRDGVLAEIPLLFIPHLTEFKEKKFNGITW